MAAVGGSIESISINGRIFPVASDAEANRKLGGFENEVQANGDGTARIVKTRVPWSLDGVTVEIDDVRGDQEFLQEVANGNVYVPIAITFASGLVYQGDGILTGEIQASSQSATAPISLMGPGEMTKQ
jgi:hypothetical protein